MTRHWIENPGICPEEARGKRVEVQLRTGKIGKTDGASGTPHGWAADGKGGCRWTLSGSPFDIVRYRVL